MDEGKLNIFLLGPPVVTLRGRPVKITRRLNRALLCYLASQIQPSTRVELCELFWPNKPDASQRKNLREALSQLKKELAIPAAIIVNNDQVMLNPEKVFSDLLEFRRFLGPLLMNSSPVTNDIVPNWMVTKLVQVMLLRRSTQFMQGVRLPISAAFERWMEITNQTYIVASLKAVNLLVDYHIAGGFLDEALVWLRKGLEIDPLNNEMNYLTLTCLRDKGMAKQLIDNVNYLEKMYLDNEEPFPERFAEIKTRAEEGLRHPERIIKTAWPLEEKSEVVFTGRQVELGQLNRMLHRKGVVLLRGEAGIGKTRLLKEFYQQQSYPPRLIYCLAHPLVGRVPFQTIIEGLSRGINEEVWNLLDEKYRNALTNASEFLFQNQVMITQLESGQGWLPLLGDAFRSAQLLLEKFALNRPVLFILDDAWQSDRASITLIAYLIEHGYFKNNGLLVIVTRLDAPNELLAQMIQRHKKQKQLAEINLEALSVEETGHLVQSLTGSTPSKALVDRLFKDTRGNPYYLVEIVRCLQRDGVEGYMNENENTWNPPDEIRSIFSKRIRNLTEDEWDVFRAAAILGNSFGPDVLEQMVNIGPSGFVNAMENLCKSIFLEADKQQDPPGGYHFLHDLDRRIIASEMDPSRARMLHLRAIDAIIHCRGDVPEQASVLAAHFAAAGDLQEGFKHWLAAGRYARSTYSWEEAYNCFDHALRLTSQRPGSFNEQEVHELINEWGNYAFDQSDFETSKRIFQTSLDEGERVNSNLLIGTGLSGLGRNAGLETDPQNAVTLLESAIRYLHVTSERGEEIEAHLRLGDIFFRHSDYISAKSIYDRAMLLEEDVSNDQFIRVKTNIKSMLSLVSFVTGYVGQALEQATSALNESMSVPNQLTKVQAHASYAVVLIYNGRYKEAIQAALLVNELAEKLGMEWWQYLLIVTLARSYLYTGDLDNAWLFANKVLERGKFFPADMLYDEALEIVGEIYRLTGETRKAEEYYERGYSNLLTSVQNIESLFFTGVIMVETGRRKRGMKAIEKAIMAAAHKELGFVEARARMTRLFLLSGEYPVERFEQEGREILAEMRSRGFSQTTRYEKLIPARAAEIRGEIDLAIQLYLESAEHDRQLGVLWPEFEMLKKIIHLTDRKGETYRTAKVRIKELFAGLSQKATTTPVKGLVQRFIKTWRYV